MAEEEKKNVEETKPKKEEMAPKKEEAQADKPKEAQQAAPAGRVKPSNCVQCNKPLKRGNWYYRNGKFYCNKRCWKKSTEKVA